MKVSGKSLLVVLFFPLFFSLTAQCQNGVTATLSGGGFTNTLGPGQGQSGAPYSAVRETETVQTLSDGTHITRKTRMQFYRDSLGRTRTETFAAVTPGGPLEQQNITIFDPVEGVNYFLNVRSHTGTLNRLRPIKPLNPPPSLPVNAPANPPANLAPRPPQPDPKFRSVTQREDLGMQTIEGVWAKGTRITTTIPVDAQGNDRPLTTVSETWLSEELRTPVLTKRSDPRNGETTERLINIDRSEPDPSLFRPPTDYTINEPQGQ